MLKVIGVALVSAFVFCCVGLVACAAAPSSSLAIEGSADEAEQDLCVKNATSRADADNCRHGVQVKYAALMAFDAGVDGSDGGK